MLPYNLTNKSNYEEGLTTLVNYINNNSIENYFKAKSFLKNLDTFWNHFIKSLEKTNSSERYKNGNLYSIVVTGLNLNDKKVNKIERTLYRNEEIPIFINLQNKNVYDDVWIMFNSLFFSFDFKVYSYNTELHFLINPVVDKTLYIGIKDKYNVYEQTHNFIIPRLNKYINRRKDNLATECLLDSKHLFESKEYLLELDDIRELLDINIISSYSKEQLTKKLFKYLFTNYRDTDKFNIINSLYHIDKLDIDNTNIDYLKSIISQYMIMISGSDEQNACPTAANFDSF